MKILFLVQGLDVLYSVVGDNMTEVISNRAL